jgi:ribosome-associated protein
MLRSSHGTPREGQRPPPKREPLPPIERPARPPKGPRAGAKPVPGGAPLPGAPGAPGPSPARARDRDRDRDDEGAKLKKARPAGPALSSASDESREIAVVIAVAALEKKASGLEVIDVAGKVDYADFLVLMSGRSDRHVTALASAIEEALRKRNKRALAVEGLPHANWVLMDFGDVVVHVFQDDARATYDIDGLWMDARRIPVPLPDAPR